MPLNQAQRQALEAARAAGAVPRSSGRGLGLSVTVGGKRLRLAGPDGRRTEAGKAWFPQGEPLPFNTDQEPILRGRNEYIKLRDDRTRLTRQMKAGKWVFTKMGREFYERNRQTFILDVPVIVETVARNGELVRIRKHFSSHRVDEIGRLSVPRVLEGAEQMAYLREAGEKLIASLPEVPGKGRLVATDSDRQHFYDPDGQWLLNSQEIVFPDDGGVRVETVLERRLFGTPFVSPDVFASWGLHPTGLLDLGGNCVSTQLAELGQGRWTTRDVEASFDKAFAKLYAGKPDSVYEGAETWKGNGANVWMVQELAMQMQTPLYVVWNNMLIHRFTPAGARKHRQALAMAISGDHCFWYSHPDAKNAIASMSLRTELPAPSATRLLNEGPRDPEKMENAGPFDQWEEVLGASYLGGPGHYKVQEERVDTLRAELIAKGCGVRVHMRNVDKISALSIKGKEGRTVIHVAPEHADYLSRWADTLQQSGTCSVPYQGEGHGSYALKVLLALVMQQIKFPRALPTREDKQTIGEAQGYKCAKCGEEAKLQIDHIQPLSEGGVNEIGNYQGLCALCHGKKTYEEQLTSRAQQDPLASVLSPDVHQAFHEGAKAPQFVMTLRPVKSAFQEVDAVKSRRNALVQNQDPLPIFCVLDEIRPVHGPEQLSDYMFVDKEVIDWGTGLRAARFLPYTGARWYCKQAVRVMFERGVVAWGDVKYALQASTHLAPEILRQAIMRMEETLQETTAFEDQGFGDKWDAAKYVPLAAIGVLNSNCQYSYLCRSSTCSEDARVSGTARRRQVKDPFCVAPALKDGLVYDYVRRVQLLTWRSYRPIGQIALDMDLVHIAQALDVARKFCTPKQLLFFNTDCVAVSCAKVQREKLEQAVAEVRYDDGTRVLRVKAPPRERVEKLVSAMESVRHEEVAEPRPPPVADTPPPVPVGPWVDTQDPSPQQVADAVRMWLGALLIGCGGTGKTWLARKVIELLRAMGYDVQVVAFTHLAAQNIGGKTIHAFLHEFPSFKGVLVIEEGSLVPVTLWGELVKYVHCGARFLVLGDFRGQFLPAHNTWKGTELTVDVEESALLRRLCGGRRFELTVNRRSDRELFEFYSPICRGGAREQEPLSSLLHDAHLRFPARGGDLSIRWHLTLSNKARIDLNRRINAHEAQRHAEHTGESAEFLEGPPESELQQGFYVFPDLRLVGSKTEEGVKNGVFYTVLTPRDGNKTVLQVAGLEETVRIYTNKLTAHVRPAAALTYFGSQGRTLDGTVKLHNTRSPFFTRRHLVVGVGRATGAHLVQVV